MRDEQQRGIKLNLTEEEIAFYDALADNESAKQVLGDKTLHKMAWELVETVRKNVRTDWTLRENVQARLRVLVKRLLKKYMGIRQTNSRQLPTPSWTKRSYYAKIGQKQLAK